MRYPYGQSKIFRLWSLFDGFDATITLYKYLSTFRKLFKNWPLKKSLTCKYGLIQLMYIMFGLTKYGLLGPKTIEGGGLLWSSLEVAKPGLLLFSSSVTASFETFSSSVLLSLSSFSSTMTSSSSLFFSFSLAT